MADEKKPRKGLNLHRMDMPRQDPKERIKNFNEVALGYTAEMAIAEAERCLQCKKPVCIDGCPAEVKIPEFIKLVTEGKFIEASRKIKETNALPAICGRVCPQEEQCELVCVLNKKGAPVAIGRLERFVADYEAQAGAIEMPELPSKTGKRVAVVGSGPASLTVAADLALMGHDVVIFEALHKAGGVLVYGIPEFRLPKAIVQREVDYIQKLGASLHCDAVIGKTFTVNELLSEEAFDAVFLGLGAGLPWFMDIPGENLNGVYSANEFLTRSNLMKAYLFPEYDTPIKIGRKVAVVGGGNVAMDSVRTALRLGAEEAHIVYRRSRVEMPARNEEIENAEAEGVIFDLLTNPVEILGDEKGWVKGIRCIRMGLGEPDESGRRRPIPIEGSEFDMEVDLVVMAIGTGANPLVPSTTPDMDTNRRGYIVADPETCKTTKEGVFAGGDIIRGSATVILAVGDGKKAARSIDQYLKTGEW